MMHPQLTDDQLQALQQPVARADRREPERLTIDVLEAFYAVIHSGGDAGQARRELGISQPNMSKRLKLLREPGAVLTRPWLVRSGKNWRLTPEGAEVIRVVEEILYRYAELSSFAKRLAPVKPVLHFSCGQLAVVHVVKEAFALFRRIRPNVELHISTMPSRERIAGVASGAIDLALVTEEQSVIKEIARRTLHIETFEEAQMVAVCARTSPLASALAKFKEQRPVPLEQITELPLVLPESNSDIRRRLDDVIARGFSAAKNRRITLQVGGWPHVMTYVRMGAGVGIVSSSAVDKRKGLIVRPLDPQECPPSVTSLICRVSAGTGNLDLSPDGRLWMDTLKAAVKRLKRRA